MDWKVDTKSVVKAIQQYQENELFTNCVLVASEGIHISVHSPVLSKSPFLRKLMLDSSCCRGQCRHQEHGPFLFPDVSYHLLSKCVEFLYTGKIVITKDADEKKNIRSILLHLLGMSGSIVVFERKEGWVDCVECGEYLDKEKIADHMVRKHVMEPARHDLARVNKGDNTRVECSYREGRICELDQDINRFNNGLFNYVGRDPKAVVLDHYREVHLKGVVDHLRVELGISGTDVTPLLDAEEFSRVVEGRDREVWGNSQDKVEEFLRSSVPMSEKRKRKGSFSSQSDSESEYSAGMSSLDEHSEQGISQFSRQAESKSKKLKAVKKKQIVRVEYPPVGDTKLLVEIENKKSLVGVENGDLKSRPKSRGPVKQCRRCKKKVSEEQFKRHVTSHLYSRWNIDKSQETFICPFPSCGKTISKEGNYILHLATVHGELNQKLAEHGESLSDYEIIDTDLGDNLQEQKIIYQTSNKVDLLGRHNLSSDWFDNNLSLGTDQAGHFKNLEGDGNLEAQKKTPMEEVVEEETNIDDLLSEDNDIAKSDAGNSDATVPLQVDIEDRLREFA